MSNPPNDRKMRPSSDPTEGIAGTPLATMPQIPLNSSGTPIEKDWPNKGRLHVDSEHVGYIPTRHVVFDLDNKNGKLGTVEYARIRKSLGLSTRIPTFATRTPSGGLHLYCLKSGIGFPNAVDVCGFQGIDIRVAPGGYVRDVPSPGYTIINRGPAEPMHDREIEFWGNKFAERDAKIEARKAAAGGTQRHSLMGLLHSIHNAPQGQRNATLFWAASRVAEMPAPRHRTALRQIERAAADIGLNHTEIDKTISSAMGGAR